MRKNYFVTSLFLLLFIVASIYFFNVFRQNSSGVGNGYEASNVLGQNDFESSVLNNIVATSISLMDPSDIEIDSVDDRLFVYDDGNDRVLVYNLNSNDTLIDSTADFVLGQDGLEGSTSCGDQGVTNSSLCGGGLAYDPNSKTLFVSDYERSRILLFDVTTIVNGETAFGVIGQVNFTNFASSNPPTQASINQASKMDYDSENNRLFVSDYHEARVLVMNYDKDTFVDGQNFDVVLGRADFVTGGVCPAASSSTLCYPSGLAFNASTDQLFVTDYQNQRVLVFDASVGNLGNGDSAVNVLGQADFTTTTQYGGLTSSSAKGFNYPVSVEIDETSNLAFIGDGEARTYVFDIATIEDFQDATYVLGQTSFSTQNCETTISASITCVALGFAFSESNNQLYVIDGGRSRILGFDTSTISNGEAANQLIGQASYTVGYDNYLSEPNSIGLDYAYDIEFDYVNNRLYVLDYNNNRILVHNTNAQGIPLDNQADFVIGQQDMSSSESSCSVSQETVCYPEGIVSDIENERLFVVDSTYNRVLIFDVSTIQNGMLPDNVIGQIDFDTDSAGSTVATLDYPTKAVYDESSEYLYVSDTNNNRVLGYDLSTGVTNGMSATRVIGQENFEDVSANRGSGMDINTLDYPTGLAIDSINNRLFVSDYDNGRVMIFDISSDGFTNGLNAYRVIGSNTFTDSNYDTFSGIYGLDIDSESQLLYAADQDYSRVFSFDISSITNGESPISVFGQQDFTQDYCNNDNGYDEPEAYSLCEPIGVEVNPENGNLYIADSRNHRALIYKFARITQSSFSSGESGTAYSQSLNVDNDQGNVEISIYGGTLPTGLSIVGNSITGTPTTTGTYNFTLEISDDNGENGVFRQLQEYTILIDPQLIDTDGDGITDVIEQASPNLGDANDDNIQDSLQDNVTVMVNPVTDNYVVLESNCNSNDSVDVDPNSNDDAFTYPFGMIEFVINCTNPGDSATVQLIFFENEDANQFVLRKFDGTNYDTVGDYTIQEGTLDGEEIITVTYNIIDGGILDQDGVANGTIVDPVGLAQDGVGTPNTGLGGSDVYSR